MYRGILLLCSLAGVLLATSTVPAWNRKGEKDLSFFRGKGFSFEVDDSMAMHYDKPTVEICVIFPDEINDDGLQHKSIDVSIDSEEIQSSLQPHAYNGRKRIILTLSQAFAGKSQLVFSFSNDKTATDGVQYRLSLAKIMDDWRLSKRSSTAATRGPVTRP